MPSAKMPSSQVANDIPIAVIGLACRFPGEASTPSKFWDMLKEGRNAYSPTSSRWNSDAFYHPSSTRTNVIPTKGGHFIKEDPYVYDAAFFNITATEAIALDPKQRMAMEVTYEALENANFSLQDVWGTQTTCYIGSTVSDYRDALIRDFMQNPKYHLLGTGEEMISNRISHFLNTHGPSATVTTACSSSLMATHMAVQSIKSGEADMAITGGVGLILTPDYITHLANLSFLNPAGQSKAFDESAGGYGRGEGCGIIVLKRLDKALADGDNIRSVIRATGANSDGYTQGVTMPSLEAQVALIKHVYESNGLDFGSTQYVEAHGTGTKAGDPIEAEAIYSTIGKASRKGKLWMGSLKPNVGHLEPAAGVASIIKGILALEHGQIPPNILYNNPNPAIPFDKWNMAVPTALTPWPVAHTKRVSINGFGMGGTNGHVVLEAFNPNPMGNSTTKLLNGSGPVSKPHSRARIFTFSSYDKAGFKRNATALDEHLASLGPAASRPEYLANLAHTLSGAKSSLAWKDACIASSATELRDYLNANPGENASRDASSGAGLKRIGFVFTGQGAQWARMGVEMLDRPVFGASVAKSAQFLRDVGCTWDPVDELLKSQEDGSRLSQPEISQPICSVLQIALVDELRAWGVTPSRVVGHSSGEIAAAYSIGALSHSDAITAAFFRGVAATKLRGETPGLKLGMMAAGCSREEADALVAEHSKARLSSGGKFTVSVACVNSPSSVTLSGDAESLELLRTVLDERKVFARRLNVEMAYHSTYMNKIMDFYLSTIENVTPLSPEDEDETQGTMVSSVTGYEISPEALGPYYWVRNLVSPVLFSDAVKELVFPDDGDGNTVDLLIEVGPHSALGGPVEQILSHHGIEKVNYESIIIRGKNGLKTSLQLASKLFLAGVPLNLAQVNGDLNTRQLTDLPPYQWNHSKAFRHETRIQRELMMRNFPSKSLIGAQNAMMDETQHVWRNFIRLNDEPWIRGHKIGDTVLLPAAGMVSMALSAAQQLAEPEKTLRTLRLREVSFSAAMAIPEDSATEVITTLRPHLIGTSGSSSATWWEFTISSSVGVDELRDNCRGLIALEYKESTSAQMAHENVELEAARVADFHRIVKDCPNTLSKADFYAQCAKISWNYGELFQGVEKIHIGDGQTAYEVKLVDIGETYSRGLERPFLIHGAALDAIIHGALGGTYKNKTFQQDKPLLPTYIGELEISLDIPDDVGYILPTSCVSKKLGFNAISSDIVSFDTTVSKTFLSMTDFRLTELGNDDKENDDKLEVDPAEITSEVRWEHAIDILKPEEIAHIISEVTHEDRAVKLLNMLIHDNPAATVIELVSDSEALSHAIMPRLKGTIMSSQVKYAVAAEINADMNKSSLFGEAFTLGRAEEPLSSDITPADLLVVSKSISTLEDLDKVLARFTGFGKPDASVILTIDSKAAPALEAKGFRSVCPVDGAALYKHQPQNANGVIPSDYEFVIIEPSAPSTAIKSFSSALKKVLEEDYHKSVAMTWTDLSIQSADETQGKTFISLMELENPFLANLSESDFEKVKKLMTNCEHLLWVTGSQDPAMAVVDGLSRTARNENASLKFQVLRLLSSPDTAIQHGPSLAMRLATSSTKDDEFREYDGLLKVSRFFNSVAGNESVRYCLEDSIHVQQLKNNDAPEEALRLTIGKPGLLDTLAFIHDERFDTPLGEMEVEVDVRATGVNFKDVMASMGLVEVSFIGHEASGTIVATGSKAAERFQVGDRVVISGEGMHATKLRSDHRLAVKIPDTMSFEEAAVLPTVHATAYHALVNVAKLRSGQSVLIHAAAGGVGQAALQLAKYLDLVAYVTVGSEDKRALVMEKYGVPAANIFNSRDASFAKAIKRVTGGRGVDCVLNSLSGELLRASWECVAMFGTFVEIGLRDITNNMRLDMRPFIKCTTFAFINLTNFFDDHKDIASKILQETFDLVHKGVLYAPTPLTAYPVSEIETAFRTMQRGQHRGKLALSYPEGAEAKVYRRAKDALKLDTNATYLIVGGLGGLGRSLAREFVACGAKNIAFLSRSGAASTGASLVIEELSERGAQIKAYRADISNEKSLFAAMEQCSHEMPPIRGVVQMAMVLRDGVLENMSYADWTTGLSPKVQGTLNLDQYFDQSRPLDFFIACSSVSGVCGNAGQAQYAAGNTFQDALAQSRRHRGLKAMSVNLGIMLGVGAIAETAGVGNNLAQWEDVIGIREPAFHALMKSLIVRQRDDESCPAQVCTGLGSADLLTAHGLPLPYYFADPRMGPLAATSVATQTSAGEQGAAASLVSRLSEATGPEQATEFILDALVNKIADMLQIPASEVDPSRPMYRYGVDSLVALEVKNWITREVKANVPLLEILAAVPMTVFAGKLTEKSKLVVGSD